MSIRFGAKGPNLATCTACAASAHALGDAYEIIRRGEAALVEMRLPEASPAVGKAIRDLQLPADTVIVSIIRDGKLVIPRGDTSLQTDDEVLAVSTVKAEPALKDALVGPA